MSFEKASAASPSLKALGKLGCHLSKSGTTFRLFAPAVLDVELLLYRQIDQDKPADTIKLHKDGQGVWAAMVSEQLQGWYYEYIVDGEGPFADPYSLHVASIEAYPMRARTLIIDELDLIQRMPAREVQQKVEDLMILEVHAKDMVARNQELSSMSIYKAWTHTTTTTELKGPFDHIHDLGANAVEFLPLAKSVYHEPPYQPNNPTSKNDWNPTAVNHWGYMTSYFCAPETRYATPSDLNNWHATKPHAVFELQDLVLSCREKEITPILDVVFNHSSMYDQNLLTSILGKEYFRIAEDGSWLNRSMTGNELDTNKVAVRHLILESLRIWIEVYGFEGFRFDLAGLLDPDLWTEIKELVDALQPGTILIAEPWGGTYRPHQFSLAGWASWNDRFRNGIKGIDPIHQQGAIFQQWVPDGSRATLENWLRGTLVRYEGGLFERSIHAVNYLESHDGHTLGDFIRIAHRGENSFDSTQHDDWIPLSTHALKQMKLAHLALLTTPGCVMLHQGQSFAHPKIVEESTSTRLDHDAYNKDNETSWIDWSLQELNMDLHQYTKGLVGLRHSSNALRSAIDSEICFDHFDNPWHLVKIVWGASSLDLFHYIIGFNFDPHSTLQIDLQRGPWECVVDHQHASPSMLYTVDHQVSVPPVSGIVLRKLRQ